MEAFPAHCDCLALANILAFRLDRADSFDRTGSGNHSGSYLQKDLNHNESDISRSLQNGNSRSHNSGNIDMAASTGGSNAGNAAKQMDQAVQDVSRSNSVSG